MKTTALICYAALALLAFSSPVDAAPARDVSVVLVVGASGTEEYGRRFASEVQTWQVACAKAAVPIQIIGNAPLATPETEPDDAGQLATVLKEASQKPEGQLWLVWIGHGTFDGREAKFNLRGPDVSATEVAEWLKPLKQELVVVAAASASAAFLETLHGPRRVIVSATKSADEVFYPHFGEFFAPAIGGLPEADLDQDHQVSILEAFLYASKKTAEFYEHEDRIATEHALIEDNGDGIGTRAEVFIGLQPQVPKGVKADGSRAAQIALVLSSEEAILTDAIRSKRDTLENRLEAIKAQLENLGDERYYGELEKVLSELAELYR